MTTWHCKSNGKILLNKSVCLIVILRTYSVNKSSFKHKENKITIRWKNMAPQMASLSVFPLEKLPDEVILHILSYFKLKDLMNCCQTSKRIRRIAQDENLWQRVDVNDKKISLEFLEMILGTIHILRNHL